MLSVAKKRILLVYVGVFAVVTGILPSLGLPDFAYLIIDNISWASFYLIGAIMILRFDRKPMNAASLSRLIISTATAVFILYLKPSVVVAGLSSYVTGYGGFILVIFLAYTTNFVVMCFGLLLVVGSTTRRLPLEGRIAIIRFALLVVAVSIVRTLIAFVLYGFTSAFPEASVALYATDSLLAALLYSLPCFYLMRSYLISPTGEKAAA